MSMINENNKGGSKMKPIKCQSGDCNKNAKWRDFDTYIQQGRTHLFFYYYCDKCYKEIINNRKELTSPSHTHEYSKIAA